MTWQVLPEGSDQPIDQGQGTTYEDCVQQAFQSASSGGQGGDPSQQGLPGDPSIPPPADPSQAPPGDPSQAPPPGAGADPTKVSHMKTADGVPASVENKAKSVDVTKLDTYETIQDGGHTYNKADFANNAGDDLRDLDDSTSPEMAPGGGSFKDNNKKASVEKVSALKAMELVDAYVQFGIVTDNRTARYAAAGKVQKLSRDVVNDRLDLLAEVERASQRIASRPRNTVPRLASNSRVPNLARSASTQSESSDADFIWTL